MRKLKWLYQSLFAAVSPGTSLSAITLGMKFYSDVAGIVKGLKFYKSIANTGTHVGGLYDTAGNLLAQGTFASETASGWQTLYFTNPVAINAATNYYVAYFSPTGNFSTQPEIAINNNSLHAPATHGYYSYGSSITFPTVAGGFDYVLDVIMATSGVTCWLQPFLSNGLTLPLEACPTSTFTLPPPKFELQVGTIDVLISQGVNLGGGGKTTGLQITDSSTNTSDTLSANLLLFFNGSSNSTATIGTNTPGTTTSQGIVRIFNGSGTGKIASGETILLNGDSGSGNGQIQLYGTLFLQDGTAGHNVIFSAGTSATANAGAATLPANPVGFIPINVGGTDYKIPYYAT